MKQLLILKIRITNFLSRGFAIVVLIAIIALIMAQMRGVNVRWEWAR